MKSRMYTEYNQFYACILIVLKDNKAMRRVVVAKRNPNTHSNPSKKCHAMDTL